MFKPEPKEIQVLLRFPEDLVISLDEIIAQSRGRIKSRNELIVSVLRGFVADLRNQDEARKKKDG